MLDKLCVCGHAMEDRGAQTLEMNGSSLGSNIWTDHVDVEMYICPWCGRMAFFEPEEVRKKRFQDICEGKTVDELRALLYDNNPELLQSVARECIEEKESLARWKEQKRKEGEERREERRKMFARFLGKDDEDDKPTKNRPPEF